MRQRPERAAPEEAGGASSDQPPARFADFPLLGERFDDLVEHPVDESAAAGSGVVLGQVDVFVQGDLDGNRGERHQLGQGGRHDEVVHEDDALDVPVTSELLDIAQVFAVIDEGFLEERPHEVQVVVVFEFGQYLHIFVRLAHGRQRADHHGQHMAQVVVPEDRLFVQRFVEGIALLQLGSEKSLEQLLVLLQGTGFGGHVALVVVGFDKPVVEGADQLRITRPSQLAGSDVVADRVAVGQTADRLVLHEFGIGVEVFVSRQFFAAGQLLALLGVTGDFDRKNQHLEIEVVCLVDRGEQGLFGGDHVVGLRFEVCIEGLDRLCP